MMDVEYDPATGEVLSARDLAGRARDIFASDVEIACSIAPGASAWRISGEQPPSAKVTLEIPSSEFASIMRLVAMGGMPLKATFKVDTAD